MLSVVVNFFNNRREAQNTLHSLTRGYQSRVEDIPYEVSWTTARVSRSRKTATSACRKGGRKGKAS